MLDNSACGYPLSMGVESGRPAKAIFHLVSIFAVRNFCYCAWSSGTTFPKRSFENWRK